MWRAYANRAGPKYPCLSDATWAMSKCPGACSTLLLLMLTNTTAFAAFIFVMHCVGVLAAMHAVLTAVSYTHLTLPTNTVTCRSRWSPYH